MLARPTQQPTELTVADLSAAGLAGYLARVESIGVARRYVRLASADVDAYLGVVHFWAAAGAPAGSFELPLPRLREFLQLAKGTLGDALDRLDELGLLSYTTSPVKSVATRFELGPVGDKLVELLVKFQGQNLTPKYKGRGGGSGSNSDPNSEEGRGQNLTPKPLDRGQNLTPNAEPENIQVQSLTPKQKTPPLQNAVNDSVTECENCATSNGAATFDHGSIIDSKVKKELPTKTTKVKRAKKGDADFPAEVVESFEKWFERYGIEGRRVHRAEALVEWGKLSEADRELADSVTDSFVAAKKDCFDSVGKPADYRPHPHRFLATRTFAAWADKLAATKSNQPTATNATASTNRRVPGKTLAVPTVGGYF
jgi:hypothetical protein